MTHPSERAELDLTLVAPAHNEEENIDKLVDEVFDALDPLGIRYEFIIVDDGSTDTTRSKVLARADQHPWLRCVVMTNTPQGKGNGQSAAFAAGFAAARGALIATMDADLQNDPKDLGAMLELLREADADFVQGDRSKARAQGDAWIRQFGSRIGRAFRRMILADTITDTGCSLRVMKREIALRLPLEFKGVHRFIPVSARHMGYSVVEIDVTHRPRHAGEPKYGMGITKRALPGLVDCFAVRWMSSRRRPVTSEEHAPSRAQTPESVEERVGA